MDADRVFSSGSEVASGSEKDRLPMALDGEIIPPGARRQESGSVPPRDAAAAATTRPGTVLIAAIVVALLGLGAAGGYFAWDRARAPDATMVALSQLQRDVGTLKGGVDTLKGNAEAIRQDEAVRGLKRSVDTLKAELETARTASAAALAQLNAKFDKTDKDPSGKLADIAARLDRLDRDPGPKLNDIAARLDRIERQVSSPTTTGSVAPPHVAPVPAQAAQPVDKTLPKPATIGNWIVRDVYDGIALVEGRSGGIREVTPGEMLPGAGEVRSIERRGRAWIVVTSRGIIDDSTW